jgi:hypothetical protein
MVTTYAKRGIKKGRQEALQHSLMVQILDAESISELDL